MRSVLLAATAIVAIASAAQAQDPGAEPAYGSVTLQANFPDDPHTIELTAGGGIDASAVGCIGMVADAPDYDLYYTAGDFQLFLSATSSEDVSLVVNAPDGSWICDDDSAGALNPGITIDSPQAGLYDIWVGAVSDAADGASASLHISEIGYGADGLGGEGASSAIDASGTPYFGSVDLTAGFANDPYSVWISAGGSNDASTLGGSCVGTIGGPPDFNLNYSAGSFPLYISATSDADTTLVVNAPDGSWVCDDDGADTPLDPGLTWGKPQSGVYNIWVGHYSGGENPEATLHISETGFHSTRLSSDGAVGGGSGIDAGAAPVYGDVELTAGFTPDPYTLSLTPGGDNDARSVDDTCAGNVGSAPDFDLYYTAGSYPLHIYAESDQDTTLVINTPDGAWICDDDSSTGLNPGVSFKSPQSGLYDIWVGTFGGAEGSATLNISENRLPTD